MKPTDNIHKTTKPSLVHHFTPDFACSEEALKERIAVAAYYKAEARGFEPGHDIEDWVTAETEHIA